MTTPSGVLNSGGIAVHSLRSYQFQKLSWGSETSDMSSEGLGEMFEGDSADVCGRKFSLTSMGGRAEGLACADPGARTPIGVSENLFILNTRHVVGGWTDRRDRLNQKGGRTLLIDIEEWKNRLMDIRKFGWTNEGAFYFKRDVLM